MEINVATKIANEIIAMFNKFGNLDYIGEPVSQIEHMCQTAQLAESNNADNETIIAAFLHDIGHLYEYQFPDEAKLQMDRFGLVDHEKLGGNYLREKGFSENVAKLVENHVNAKRYSTFKFPEYYHLLSEASKQTLIHQGGKMNENEALQFEQDPLHSKYIALRQWDEQAKEIQVPLPDIEKYRLLIIQHLANN